MMHERLLLLLQLIVVASGQTCGTTGGGYDYNTRCNNCGPAPCVSGTTCYSCAGDDGYCYRYRCPNSNGGITCRNTPCPVSECSRGEFLSSDSCRDCSSGKYQASYSHSDSSCDWCPSGQYQSSTGSSSCRDCPSGTSSPDRTYCLSTPPPPPPSASSADLQASSLVVTDCAVKIWKADWMDCDSWLGVCTPERITLAIFDTDPELESPDCQESIGNHYDRYFPSAARSAVSALSGGEDIPNGDEVCHLICDNSCGFQWIDPTEYFIAVEIECELPILMIIAIVVGAVIVVICGVIGCSRMKGQSKKVAEPQVALPAATTATAPPAATFAPAIALAQTEPLVPTGPINTGNVAITIAEPAPTAPPATAESGTDLQAELSLLKMPELRKRAKEAGISEDAIENARDQDQPKQAVIMLIVNASQARVEASAREAATLRAVKAELQQLKMPDLRKRAAAAGASAEAIEDARDGDDPKADMIELILAHQSSQP